MRIKPYIKELSGALALVGALFFMNHLSSIGFIDSEIADRIAQIMYGVVLVILGNAAPKALKPLSQSCSNPARRQSCARTSGWTFVIAGILYSLIWIVAPLEIASTLGKIVIGSSIVVVAIVHFLPRVQGSV